MVADTKNDLIEVTNEKNEPVAGAPGAVAVPEDPKAPSKEVSSARQRISNIFTIIAAGAALFSDGYFNNLMTMVNVVLTKAYPHDYTSAIKTQVSNALLVGAILGQITIGFTCDYMGRKAA